MLYRRGDCYLRQKYPISLDPRIALRQIKRLLLPCKVSSIRLLVKGLACPNERIPVLPFRPARLEIAGDRADIGAAHFPMLFEIPLANDAQIVYQRILT